MKFSYNDAIEKQAFGIKILEYYNKLSNASYPLDCAIAYFRSNEYPCKINHGFYEMFFIMNGECTIEFVDETINLQKFDMYIIPPERKHSIKAINADVLIICTPPFNPKNVEFCQNE